MTPQQKDPKPLVYPFPEPPALATTIEVAPGIRWLRMPLPFALDHINLWLIEAHDGWTIVDTGYALPAAKEAWRIQLQHYRPNRVVVTHFHPDHIGLAAWLMAEYDLPLFMSHGELLSAFAAWLQAPGHGYRDMVAFFARHGLGTSEQEALLTRGAAYPKGVPELPATYERLRAGDTLTLGETTWRVIVGYGHSPEHVSLYCPERKVLISGDMLLPKISTNVGVWAVAPHDDPLGDFLASLDAFTALPDETLVLPSHGLPFQGIAARVAALKAHHDARFAELLAACAKDPCTAAELVPILFPRALDLHQLVFALGETIAHLNHAWRCGWLQRTVDRNGMIRFAHNPTTDNEGDPK